MKFSYKAIDDVGTVVAGTLEAESREAVYVALAERGLLPTEVASGENPLLVYLRRLELALERIRPVDLIFFTKQFRTLFKAGIPVVEALRILEFQTQNGKLKRVVAQMGEEISAGSSLGDAFAAHPTVFPPLYIGMIRAGEASGSLVGVLGSAWSISWIMSIGSRPGSTPPCSIPKSWWWLWWPPSFFCSASWCPPLPASLPGPT
ncbi:type II secretion system F family protein [Desulfurivibrio sp. D14AmB]|uniref:type II secretion system F family protein n=1 Tax=Desulfurivibrio sp. D14AmB TaxID=3374370 RepID=UPI00376EC178